MNKIAKIKSLKGCLTAILLFGVLASCSSQMSVPTHYFFLETPSYPSNGIEGSSKYPTSLLVKKFAGISPYDTVNLVVKIRPSEVRFYNYAKWVASPQEMLHHYFLKSLTFARLAEIAANRSGKNVYHLEVEIQEFGQTLENNRPYGTIKIFVGIRHAQAKTYDWYTVYHEQELAQTDQPYDVVRAINQAMKQMNQKFLKDLDAFLASQPIKR